MINDVDGLDDVDDEWETVVGRPITYSVPDILADDTHPLYDTVKQMMDDLASGKRFLS